MSLLFDSHIMIPFLRLSLSLLYFSLGGKDKNVKVPGRFDPNRPGMPPSNMMMDGPGGVGMGMGRGAPPPMPFGGGGYDMGRGSGYRDAPPGPPRGGGYGRDRGERGRYIDGARKRHRSRSRSPERRYAPRSRY